MRAPLPRTPELTILSRDMAGRPRMMRWGCLVILAALAGVVAVAGYAIVSLSTDNRPAEDICFDPEGSIGNLIPACTKLIESGRYHGSDLSGIYYTRGATYRDIGNVTQAMADFDEMVRICPDAGGYEVRAALWEQEGQHDKAIADYTRAIAAWPEWSPPYEDRGEIYLAQGEPARAVEDFTQAIRYGNPVVIDYRYVRRGVAYAAVGQYDNELLDVEHVLEDDPTNSLAWEVRGQIEAARDNRDAAIADFHTALYWERGREASIAGLKKLGAVP
jgi:tetratricopeptide (TPR) repeat protein